MYAEIISEFQSVVNAGKEHEYGIQQSSYCHICCLYCGCFFSAGWFAGRSTNGGVLTVITEKAGIGTVVSEEDITEENSETAVSETFSGNAQNEEDETAEEAVSAFFKDSDGSCSEENSNSFSLNTATADQLETISGIGPVLAERIVAYRNAHGPFQTFDDLENVEGIGARLLETIRSTISLE